jgi:hypothetical protein
VIEKGIYGLLTQATSVSALVGNRVYYILQPKGTLVPSVVIGTVATDDVYSVAGASGLRFGLYQFDAYAADYYSCRAVSRAVRLLLENYKGNLPDADATTVLGCMIEKDWDMPYEAGQFGFVYRALLEVRFIYQDTFLPVSSPASGEGIVDGGTS